MKIKLKKEGGFMGMASNANIDLEQLPDNERNAISDLIANANSTAKSHSEELPLDNQAGVAASVSESSMNQPEQEKSFGAVPPPSLNDSFAYEMKVKKGSRYVTLKFDDKNIPQEVYSIFQRYVSDIPSL